MSVPSVVPGWNPLGGARPATDDEVFELLTAAVFQARFRPAIVEQRWPAIRHAFGDFDLRAAASWPDVKEAELLEHAGMIRSPKKIRATLRNARELVTRSERHGSTVAYLASFSDEEALVRDVDEWAHYIGAPSIRWFVRAASGQRSG